MDARLGSLESRQAENDGLRAQIAELQAAADELRGSLQARPRARANPGRSSADS